MLQSPADLSLELPVRLPTRQPVGTNNKFGMSIRKKTAMLVQQRLSLLQKNFGQKRVEKNSNNFSGKTNC